MSIPWQSLKKVHDTLIRNADRFFTMGTGKVPHVFVLVADYRIFVFAAKDASGTPPFQSGKCYGVVVSKQRNEVIYYAESW